MPNVLPGAIVFGSAVITSAIVIFAGLEGQAEKRWVLRSPSPSPWPAELGQYWS
jgi:hypothetical protein